MLGEPVTDAPLMASNSSYCCGSSPAASAASRRRRRKLASWCRNSARVSYSDAETGPLLSEELRTFLIGVPGCPRAGKRHRQQSRLDGTSRLLRREVVNRDRVFKKRVVARHHGDSRFSYEI